MRFVQAMVVLIFLAAVGLFAVQNPGATTITFWTWKLTGSVALLTIVAYLLGMVTGWTILSFFRRSLHGIARRSSE